MGAKGDAVAKAAQLYGLQWTDSRVSELESGRVSPTIPTLIVLALALTKVTGSHIGIGDLLGTEEKVLITETLAFSGHALASLVEGTEFDALNPAEVWLETSKLDEVGRAIDSQRHLPPGVSLEDLDDAYNRRTAADERAAKDMDLGDVLLAIWSLKTWGRTFSEERDQRAGPDANAQKRGQIARTLKNELRESITSGDD
ncbi:hypothetical protein CH275_12185 [Rhodococcus sp. 06-235-1A]|nr:hypothetical protein CH275_12185 [Rhodococcus sp. 06-235-1A]